MSKQGAIKKVRIGVIAGCLVLTALAGGLTVRQYLAAQAVQVVFDQQRVRLEKLVKEIAVTESSIDKLRDEQEEFKKLLFDERDVPSFLDGISDSAAKALVLVANMKTQQFSEVILPQSISENSGKMGRTRIAEGWEERRKNTPEEELKLTLTLAAMPIRFQIRGTFEAIAKFINSIENYKQLLTVSNVEITNRNDYPQLNCEFTLRIYSLKQLGDIKP